MESKLLNVSATPHVRDKSSTKRIMFDVCLALLPACGFGIYNFGFSGNGKLDLEVAKVMATVDAGLFVIDCLPNNKTPEFKEKVDVFFRTIRDAHPEVPILFVESPIFPGAYWDQEEKVTLKEKNDALKEYFAKLQQQGEKNIYYFSADKIIMNPEVTVDNYHYTDLGFWQFAQSLYPVIDKIVLK